MRKLTVLDLFSGIGGFSLGLERTGGFRTVAFCEIDSFCQSILKKHWPDVPVFEDVRKLNEDQITETVGLVCGGYPCQPYSVAGKRKGSKDDRSLWPEMFRIIKGFRPTWVLCENVAGHVSMGLDSVLSDLESENYTCQALVIPACAVSLPHRRDRVWVAAYANSKRHEQSHVAGQSERQRFFGRIYDQEAAANACGQRYGQFFRPWLRQKTGAGFDRPTEAQVWPDQPPLRSADDGLSPRLVRCQLKALGNAVVPQIPEMIGRAILAAEAEKEKNSVV